jgi:hypothetical protein
MPSEVFLSHSSDDRDIAESLTAILREHGVPVWYSDSETRGAQQWHDEIGRALQRCDFFCVLLSEASVRSMWVKRETLYALQQERYRGAIAPLLTESCDVDELSWVLSSIQWIDFRSGMEDGCRDLLNMWGKGLDVDIVARHVQNSAE